MKRYLFLFSLLLTTHTFAQPRFEKLWEQVATFEKTGKIKSANDVVTTIYKKAKHKNNSNQLIKALLYQSKYALVLQEDAELLVVKNLEKEISETTFPTNAILQSILADFKWQYFNLHRWEIYNRTQTTEMINDDFRTWDLNRLFTDIHNTFKQSIANAKGLQNIGINEFQYIIIEKDAQFRPLRPTLFDLLAHRALTFFSTSESRITKPKERFYIDKKEYFAPSATFIKLTLKSKDSILSKLEALKTYQKLEAFHLQKKNIDALVDVYLERLHFVSNNSTLSNNQEIYIESLKNSFQKLRKGIAYATIKATYAKAIFDNATKNKNPENRKKALQICNEIITDYPKSEGTVLAQNLKNTILHKTLSVQNELYVGTVTSKTSVSYNNIDKLYFRIYPVSYTQNFNQYRYAERNQKIKEFFNTQKFSHFFEATLPQKNDYFQHRTEIVLPKLKVGRYLILAATDASFNTDKLFAYNYQNVSNLVAVEYDKKGKKTFQILDRASGKPIEHAKVSFGNSTKTTNALGEVVFQGKKRNQPVMVFTQNDTLHLGNYSLYNDYYNHYKDPNKVNRAKAFLFLDRSIYRPGQKVYFKSIIVSKQNFKQKVVAHKKFIVEIHDANYQLLKTFNLTTNEFGSFSESFVLPTNVLTGNFTIRVKADKKIFKDFREGYAYFSVEEYKRPKFEVSFNPVTETYLVNQEICVKGNANALLGTAISNAKVNYRVIRKTQYTHWEYWNRYQNTETQEIKNGEVTTDENGAFEIEFTAIPDATVNKEGLPVFNYEITADVTDINGETRSSTTTVKVGYHSMNIDIQTDDDFTYNTTETITVNTQNLNGEFAPATVTLKIYKLQAPNRVLRTRRLSVPDLPILTKSEFVKLFPHEAYDNEENDSEKWKKGALVFEKTINTDTQKEIKLPVRAQSKTNSPKWKSGKYIITVLGKDQFGNTIKQEKRITVSNPNDTFLADKQLFDYKIVNNKTAQQDQFIKIKLLTGTQNLQVLTEAYYNGEHFYKKMISVNGSAEITIPFNQLQPIPDSSIGLAFSLVKYADFTFKTATVNLPSKKEFLSFETTTFRDKLLPGAKEKWRFTLKNQDKKGVLAEVLASMYDASLDQFKQHSWNSNLSLPNYYNKSITYKGCRNFGIGNANLLNRTNDSYVNFTKTYAQLNTFGLQLNNTMYALSGKVAGLQIRGMRSVSEDSSNELKEVTVTAMGIKRKGYSDSKVVLRGNRSIRGNQPLIIINGAIATEEQLKALETKNISSKTTISGANGAALYGSKGANGAIIIITNNKGFKQIKARKNLNETAFFYPHLKTNANGDLSFEFETPEALTRWKVQLLGHTQTGISGKFTQNVVTQKDLMVVPNPPRFLRENDTLFFQTKIASLSNKTLNGQAKLELYDALTGKEISNVVISTVAEISHQQTQDFKLSPKGNTSISWKLVIPEGVQAIEYKVLAKAGHFTDGESSILPVLTNKMLVTESIPLTLRAHSSKNYSFNKLKNNTSTTLKNQALTLEYTTNPAWYAIQSLPYVMEFPHECAEQTFARYYANTLGSYIMNSNPKIKTVFENWKANGKLTSKLEQNEELKQILIAETPWLRDAQSETERKKRLGLLFDLDKLASQEKSMLKKLHQLQMGSGGFPWFKGGRENEYITRHIVAGFGHLKKLGVLDAVDDKLLKKAIHYLDKKFVENHQKKLKHTTEDKIGFGYYELNYLYTRSFFKNDYKFTEEARRITNLYLNKAKKDWLHRSLQEKAMLSLVWHRFNEKLLPKQILVNLQETSIINEDKGMYWKSNVSGWRWNEAPIETQALIIEAFSEITNDKKTIEELQIWLLNNKRKNNWETTKATTEAVYALLLQGNDWLSVEGTAIIKIGNHKIKTSKLSETKLEAGSGYFKLNWKADEITPKMADISIKNTSDVTQFGGYYWQYFEQLDKITNEEHKSDIQLLKQLFVKKNTDNGPTLTKIENTSLKVGDLVTVRIELQVKDNFEYVHLKDMRASAFEPVNVLSSYKWQDGLGYYQSTKDVATHFFFDYLPKGTYVLQYDVRVNNAGSFSNGISTIQSMYAPEFSSHSNGVSVKVKE